MTFEIFVNNIFHKGLLLTYGVINNIYILFVYNNQATNWLQLALIYNRK